MICPNCRSEIAEGRKFCGRCGIALSSAITAPVATVTSAARCAKCGKKIAFGKKFCGGCGSPVAGQLSQSELSRQTPAPTTASVPQAQSAVAPVALKTQSPGSGPPALVKASSSTAPQPKRASAGPSTGISRSPRKPVSAKVVGPVAAVIVLVLLAGAWFAWGVELDLVSNPAGAEVTLDGKPLGSTSSQGGALVLPHVSRGTHILSLSYPGFDVWSEPISLGWFQLSHPLTVSLPLPSFPLSVQTNPGGAKVELDAQDAGVSDASGNLVIPKVPRGQHMVTVSLDGYPSQSSTLWVAGPSSIKIDLVAAGAAEDAEVQSHLQRAQDLYQQRQFDAAIAECDEALQLAPTNDQAAKLKAQIQQTKSILGVQ